jgi:hypothetical protein
MALIAAFVVDKIPAKQVGRMIAAADDVLDIREESRPG